ncbi:MAG: ABC transporter ATP-binding protein [Candidatus Limiplasma sp.]|nr:ABC transporter ATP-binding protein [Candidatus Limiplasma sp.]
MTLNPIIEINDVSMRFNLAKERTDTLKEFMLKKLRGQLRFDEFYALKNVNFSIQKGESVALIGRNGCGKSTLLKIIAGVFYPTSGSVVVRGNVAPLIELGAGFDSELTARENIYLNGAVLGFDRAFMDAHFDEILNFSELHQFIDVPVKNFSSGMIARLGFSIATLVEAEILVVDEILAVGDFLFQQKCHERMNAMLQGGTTLLFVSHSADQVQQLCQKAVWLDQGNVMEIGLSKEVCEHYVAYVEAQGQE